MSERESTETLEERFRRVEAERDEARALLAAQQEPPAPFEGVVPTPIFRRMMAGEITARDAIAEARAQAEDPWVSGLNVHVRDVHEATTSPSAALRQRLLGGPDRPRDERGRYRPGGNDAS